MSKGKTLFEEIAEQTRLLEESSKRLSELKSQAKGEAKEAVEEFAKSRFGMSVAEIFGYGAKSEGKRTIDVKYRNPNNHSEVWSGQAQPPKFWHDMLKKAGIAWNEKGSGPAVREFLKKKGFLKADQDKEQDDKPTAKKPKADSAKVEKVASLDDTGA